MFFENKNTEEYEFEEDDTKDSGIKKVIGGKMQKEKNKMDFFTKSSWAWKFDILLAILAYFIYGRSIDAAIAVLGMTLAFSFIPLVGLIPIAGVFIYVALANRFIGWLMVISGLTTSIITKLIFYIGLFGAIIYTIVGVFAVIGLFSWITDRWQ